MVADYGTHEAVEAAERGQRAPTARAAREWPRRPAAAFTLTAFVALAVIATRRAPLSASGPSALEAEGPPSVELPSQYKVGAGGSSSAEIGSHYLPGSPDDPSTPRPSPTPTVAPTVTPSPVVSDELEEMFEDGLVTEDEMDALRQAWWEQKPPEKTLPTTWNVGAGGSSSAEPGSHYLPSHDVEEDAMEEGGPPADGPPADGSIPADAPVLPDGVDPSDLNR